MFGDFPKVSRKRFLEAHKYITGAAYDLCLNKNDDYAGEDEAYGNLRVADDWGIASVEAGLLIRMADKMRRLATLIHGKPAAVKDEKMADSLLDIINYAVFMVLALDERAAMTIYHNGLEDDKGYEPLD